MHKIYLALLWSCFTIVWLAFFAYQGLAVCKLKRLFYTNEDFYWSVYKDLDLQIEKFTFFVF